MRPCGCGACNVALWECGTFWSDIRWVTAPVAVFHMKMSAGRPMGAAWPLASAAPVGEQAMHDTWWCSMWTPWAHQHHNLVAVSLHKVWRCVSGLVLHDGVARDFIDRDAIGCVLVNRQATTNDAVERRGISQWQCVHLGVHGCCQPDGAMMRVKLLIKHTSKSLCWYTMQ